MSQRRFIPRLRAALNVLRGKPTVYGLINAEVYLSDAATCANWGLLCSQCTAIKIYATPGTPYSIDGGEPLYIQDGEDRD